VTINKLWTQNWSVLWIQIWRVLTILHGQNRDWILDIFYRLRLRVKTHNVWEADLTWETLCFSNIRRWTLQNFNHKHSEIWLPDPNSCLELRSLFTGDFLLMGKKLTHHNGENINNSFNVLKIQGLALGRRRFHLLESVRSTHKWLWGHSYFNLLGNICVLWLQATGKMSCPYTTVCTVLTYQ
jgi:hypothetical protein